MAWTDDRVELLKKLWADGLSASQIANRLGGVTRNAVIGKVHRLGLSGRATTSRSKAPRPRRRPASAPSRGSGAQYFTRGNVALKAAFDAAPDLDAAPLLAPVEELVIPLDERASILTLKECMCKWPIGDPTEDDFHFCGREAPQGSSYCEHHARIAYQPLQSRRRAGPTR